MQRRTFCELATLTALGTFVPFTSCSPLDPTLKNKLSLPLTLASLHDSKTLVDLGNAYFVKSMGEKDPDKIVQQLMQGTDGRLINTTDSLALQKHMLEKIQADFENNRTLVLNGWVLSLTEARQCALYSLTQTDS